MRQPSTAHPSEQALIPDDRGRVALSSTGTTGIQGRWFALTDIDECHERGKHPNSDCSKLIEPTPGSPGFRPTPELGMCVLGVTAKVPTHPDGTIEWGSIWGARMGLTLNDGQPYDAPSHGVAGLIFHIDGEPPANSGIRVELPTVATRTDPALWGGRVAETSPVHAGRNELRWAEVGGPPWQANPPAFDPSQLLEISFKVPARPAGAQSFSFCIRRMAVLTN